MSSRMYVCPECGLGFLGVDDCPQCQVDGGTDGTQTHIPWFRTRTRWAQKRIDGTSWFLYDSGPEPTVMQLDDVERRTCPAKNHTFVGTERAKCPICTPGIARPRVTSSPQQAGTSKWRYVAFGTFLLVVVAAIVALVAVAMDRQSGTTDSVAVEATTTTLEATTTTTAVVADPSFLDASSYEQELSVVGARSERVANRVLEINTQWDDREITQDVAAAQLALQRTEARGIVSAVDDASNLGADDHRHELVAEAVQDLEDAVAAVRTGLLEPGSRTGRDDATVRTVAAADVVLEAIDGALDLDRHRLRRSVGTPVLWELLRIGDCVDPAKVGEYTAIVACSDEGHGEVLATPSVPTTVEMTPHMCLQASWPVTDSLELESEDASWEIRDVGGKGQNTKKICAYIPGASTGPLVTNDVSHVGPFVSDQWDALDRVDLAPSRSVEGGECFEVPPEAETDLVSERHRVDCDSDHDFTLSTVVAIAPPAGSTALDRLSLRSWDVCSSAASDLLEERPYFVAEAFILPSFPGLDDTAEPMITLACVLGFEWADEDDIASFAYQSGYAAASIAVQAGVYDFGLIEDPTTDAETKYNEGFQDGQVDTLERRPPRVEITDDEWIGAFLQGNPTGWADGRGCTRPSSYPLPEGLGPVEIDGWYAGYNAGFESGCRLNISPPAWVGTSVCPYDPWDVPAIEQDVVCPPVRP